MKQFFLTFICIIVVLSGYAQNYADYFKLINKAEEKFILSKDSTCFLAYDIAFERYQPFLKDPYIAAQIALYLGDKHRFLKYLERCFANGMPLRAVNASPLIANKNRGSLKAEITELYRNSFIAPQVDPSIKEELCLRCYQSDSIKTFMGRNDSLIYLYHTSEKGTLDYVLENFLKLGKFPNERLMGITTDAEFEEFLKDYERHDVFKMLTGESAQSNAEFELRRKCPYNIVLHSKCFFREQKDLFMQAMLNGYLHPVEYGILEETSILWHHSAINPYDNCGEPEVKICYNIFGYSLLNPAYNIYTDTESGLEQVERNRKAIYMQKYSVDLAKKEMEHKEGFRFFFDFKNRP